jgi:hypothetical protein
LLEELQEQKMISEKLKAELAAFGAADPVRYERKKDAVRVAKEAAQRWTGISALFSVYHMSDQLMI